MGVRRFGPDVSRFLTPDLFFGALSNLSLSLDPITQNRYGLAAGNPIGYRECDGHVVLFDGGGDAATTPAAPSPTPADRCGGCQDAPTPVQGGASGRFSSGDQSAGGSSLVDSAKEALTRCFKKGDPSDLGWAGSVLSPICNPEKRTAPNLATLCSATAAEQTLHVGCATPANLQHDPVLKGLSAMGGNPEDTLDSLLSRNAAKAEQRQADKQLAAEDSAAVRSVGGGAPDAFDTAAAGGRHAGFLENYVGRSEEELQKGVDSLQRQIDLHQGKIANPADYLDNWSGLDPRQQTGLVSKWGRDIQRLQEQRDILRALLEGRKP
jgi:hypothetical protein